MQSRGGALGVKLAVAANSLRRWQHLDGDAARGEPLERVGIGTYPALHAYSTTSRSGNSSRTSARFSITSSWP